MRIASSEGQPDLMGSFGEGDWIPNRNSLTSVDLGAARATGSDRDLEVAINVVDGEWFVSGSLHGERVRATVEADLTDDLVRVGIEDVLTAAAPRYLRLEVFAHEGEAAPGPDGPVCMRSADLSGDSAYPESHRAAFHRTALNVDQPC